MGQKVQSDQIVLDERKKHLGNYPRQEYDEVMGLIDDRFKTPGKVFLPSVSGDTLLEIVESPKRTQVGVDGESISGIGPYESLTSINNTFLQYPNSLLDLSTGGVTGSIDVGTVPTTTDTFWRWILFTAKSDIGEYAINWGDEVSGMPSFGSDMPAVPNGQVELTSIRVQNSGGGTWNFLRPSSGDIFTHARGGGSGQTGGTGSGGGELVDLAYKARLFDTFATQPDGTTPVDNAAGKTDSSLYNQVNGLYELNYDAGVSGTASGTSMELDSAPSFTVKVGDVVNYNSEVRKITALGSINSDGGVGTPFTLHQAFTVDPSSSAVCISQAVHTVDLNNFDNGGAGLAVSSQIPDLITEALIGYADSETQGDTVPDWGSPAHIAYAITVNGTDYSTVNKRQDDLSLTASPVTTSVSGASLEVLFFANKTSGSGTVNLLSFKAFWHKEFAEYSGETALVAYARPFSGIFQNCSHSIVGGKSRFTFTFNYGKGLDAGEASGSALDVYANGQKVPRRVAGVTDDTQAYFTEISSDTIEMDLDYTSGVGDVDFQFKVPALIIDTNTQNLTKISALEDWSDGFENKVLMREEDLIDVPNTEITNRAKIPDLANDLSVNFGPKTIIFASKLERLFNETGPSTNMSNVYKSPNDRFGLCRFVGTWETAGEIGFSNDGPTMFVNQNLGVGDSGYLEIVFFGSYLNVMIFHAAISQNWEYTLDGVLQSDINPQNNSSLWDDKHNQQLARVNVASGLSVGIHTVKLSWKDTLVITGVEFGCQDNGQVRVNAGKALIGGKLVDFGTQTLLDYNSGFESGTLGTKGGKVIVYAKEDGTIKHAVNPVGATAQYLTNADHSNEQVLENSHSTWGTGYSEGLDFVTNTPSDKFLNIPGDYETALSTRQVYNNPSNNYAPLHVNMPGGYIKHTFVGTGCDVIRMDNGSTGAEVFEVYVDGTFQGSYNIPAYTGVLRTLKLCSNLPYGSHTVKVRGNSTFTSNNPGILGFVVYGPKNPDIPTNAVKLGEYNVLPSFDNSTAQNTTAAVGPMQFETGVIAKSIAFQTVLNGAGWTFITVGGTDELQDQAFNGVFTATDTDRLYGEFWGTGVVFVGRSAAAGTGVWTIQIDGVAYSTASGLVNIANSGSGNYTEPGTGASGDPIRIEITGLSLGPHSFAIQKNGGNFVEPVSYNVIQPVHHRDYNFGPNLKSVYRLSQGIKDARPLYPLTYPNLKNGSFYITGSTRTTTISTRQPIYGTSCNLKTNGGNLCIQGTIEYYNTSLAFISLIAYVDGRAYTLDMTDLPSSTSNSHLTSINTTIHNLPAGEHQVIIYFGTSAGSLNVIDRYLSVTEVSI